MVQISDILKQVTAAKDAKEKNEPEDCIVVTNRNEFIAEENNNFTLKEESKTLENNSEFENIDVSKSDLITSRLNETITDKTFVTEKQVANVLKQT